MMGPFLVLCLLGLLQESGLRATQAGGQVEESWTIQRAVEEALAHNLRIIGERESIAVADARMITARLRPNPSIGIAADHLDVSGTGCSEANGAGPSEYSLNTTFI